MTRSPSATRAGVFPVADKDDAAREDKAVRDCLLQTPPRLPAWFGYDATGSELFEQITELPTYYLTRVERALLERNASEIAEVLGCGQIAELGSGSAKKTRLLLQHCVRLRKTTYVPIDVDREMLRSSGAALCSELTHLKVKGLWGRYEAGLDWLRTHAREPLAVAFLGSNVGNATREERDTLLSEIARTLGPGGSFLVSADLDKSREVLETCYNDPAGRSAFADFRLNYLTRLNRRYGAGFVLDDFIPEAHYNADTSTVEGRLRAQADRTISIPRLGLTLRIRHGQSLNVGYSAKFDGQRLVDEIGAHGFNLRAQWRDSQAQYGLFLFRRHAACSRPRPTFTSP